MKTDILLKLAIDFSLLSLVAIGGANAIVPEMHRQLVDVSHWMTDAEFVNLFAVGQVAPGPNIMVLSLVGWRMAGLNGMIVATVAALGPTCLLSWMMGRFTERHGRAPWLDSVKRGLAPVAIGLILASGLVMARAADHDALNFAATAATFGIVVGTRVNPLFALAFFGVAAGLFTLA
ncbi:MAG: chromate transporter [Hyphomicrobiales bacterium]|nr:chromate transporter [Hyphomicrobiales bacterium]